MSMISFSTDDLPYPVQETTTDNTTPLVVAQLLLDEGKNDTSATCLTNHDRKIYADKSTQTPVPFDKCLSPLEYESTERKIHQCIIEDSAVCSQMPTSIGEYLSPLEYELMTAKPYQCSQSSTASSRTIAELPHKPIPRKMRPGFLVFVSDNAGKKPNVQTADYTIDDTKVTLPILLQGESKDDKSANCLASERSNPIGPLDQSTQISVPSNECLSPLDYYPITAIAHQCTEGFPSNSGYRLVAASSKMTTPQEIDPALVACSPGCGSWPKPMAIEQSTVILDYKPDEYIATTLLLPTLRPF